MSRGTWTTRVMSLLLLAVLALPVSAAAQAVSGTLLGAVKDNSGGVLPGVTVVVTNEGTGLTRTLVTDEAGEYTAPQIPTGTYTVAAELSGFKKSTKTGIRVGVDQRVRIDLDLQIGEMSETVSVVAETPMMQTASSELGTTVEDAQIEALPLNGRNFVNLTRTVPGVLRGIPGANIDGAGSLAWRASASFSANGQRTRDNNFMLDGVDNNETWLQTVVIFPSPDALDEFKMQTSTYSAEFGRSLGGVVNLQIKSGTNTLRGSGFEFYRDDAFDANNFFNNRAGREKASLNQHEFGGTFGGKLIQDKTFFFGSYQGHREKRGQTFLSTVPTMAMRSGDFSAVNRVIYDPAHGPAVPGQRHPVEPDRRRGAQHPHPALPRTEHCRPHRDHWADYRQLPDQPGQGARGQPDRLEVRLQRHVEQPVLRALQLAGRCTGTSPPRFRTATRARRLAPVTATSARRGSPSTTRTRSTAAG